MYVNNDNAITLSPDSGILSNPFGGASGTSSPSGRQLVSSIINTPFSLEDNLIATEFATLGQDEDLYGDIFSRQKEVRDKQRRTSPYLIKPTDKLIFGWQNHSFNPTEGFTNGTVATATENVLGEQMFDFIESIKVTLFLDLSIIIFFTNSVNSLSSIEVGSSSTSIGLSLNHVLINPNL